MKKALLVLLATGWFLCGFAQEIEFETTVHDFGQVIHNAPAVYDFVFTNTGTQPLLVQKPKSSCGCTQASWPKEPIMPDEKGMVTVTYDSKRIGNINKTVSVASNATNSPQIVLRVKGNVCEIKIVQKNGLWGCEDPNGLVIIPFQYEELKENGIGFSAKKNGKWGIVDWEHKTIIPFEYEQLKISYNSKNKDVKTMKNGKWGAVNRITGRIIPCKYDEEFDYGEKMVVKKGGKYGIIDNMDKTLIPFEYDEIKIRINDYYVKLNNKWGMVNQMNNPIVPIEYDELGVFDDNNEAKASKNGKWGVINKTNQIIISFAYEDIIINGGEVICAKKNGKWGLIDKHNKTLTKFFAEDIVYNPNFSTTLVFFAFPTDYKDKAFAGKWGAMSTNGNLLIPPTSGSILAVMAFATQMEYDKKDCNQLNPKTELEKNYVGIKSMNEVFNAIFEKTK